MKRYYDEPIIDIERFANDSDECVTTSVGQGGNEESGEIPF